MDKNIHLIAGMIGVLGGVLLLGMDISDTGDSFVKVMDIIIIGMGILNIGIYLYGVD